MNLKALIGKVNDPTRGALESAAGLCLSRTHYDVEVEHYLMKLLDFANNDVTAIFKHFEVDVSRVSGELARALDRLKSGNARTPALSPTVIKMLTEAWTLGSIDYGAGQVRTGFAFTIPITGALHSVPPRPMFLVVLHKARARRGSEVCWRRPAPCVS